MRPAMALIGLVAVAILISALTSKPVTTPDSSSSSSPETSAAPAAPKPASGAGGAQAFDKVKEGAIQATLVIANRGTMTLELYPKAAPKTVAHFVELAKSHFYDGLKFHRVEPGFVIQGGDPESKNASVDEFETKGIGTHGSGKTVPLEANLPHIANSVGLARSQDTDSGDSQFYINLKDNNSLDGNYCVFGRVIQGMDVPAKVEKGDVITSLTVK